jgi:hypothetical protein
VGRTVPLYYAYASIEHNNVSCRVDDLYNFLLLWVPHLYGELEDMDPMSRGYELVESDTELWEDETGECGPAGRDERRASDEGELTELTRESWEVSNVTTVMSCLSEYSRALCLLVCYFFYLGLQLFCILF